MSLTSRPHRTRPRGHFARTRRALALSLLVAGVAVGGAACSGSDQEAAEDLTAYGAVRPTAEQMERAREILARAESKVIPESDFISAHGAIVSGSLACQAMGRSMPDPSIQRMIDQSDEWVRDLAASYPLAQGDFWRYNFFARPATNAAEVYELYYEHKLRHGCAPLEDVQAALRDAFPVRMRLFKHAVDEWPQSLDEAPEYTTALMEVLADHGAAGAGASSDPTGDDTADSPPADDPPASEDTPEAAIRRFFADPPSDYVRHVEWARMHEGYEIGTLQHIADGWVSACVVADNPFEPIENWPDEGWQSYSITATNAGGRWEVRALDAVRVYWRAPGVATEPPEGERNYDAPGGECPERP